MRSRLTTDRLLPLFFGIYGIFWTLLFTVATFQPSAQNWGVHSLAFFPLELQLLFLSVVAALLLPTVQNFLVRLLERVGSAVASGKQFYFTLGGFAVLLLVFWAARERLFFLGDGFLLTRTLEPLDNFENVSRYAPHEPLAGAVMYLLRKFILSVGIVNVPELPLQLMSVASGIGFVFCLFRLVRKTTQERFSRLFLFGVVFLSGPTALFFGYVEFYSLSAFFLALFILTAVLYAQGECSLWYPSLVFLALVMSHTAMICLLPAFMVLIFTISKRLDITLLAFGGIFIGIVLLFLLLGFDWKYFADMYIAGGTHVLSFTDSTFNGGQYTLFSFAHLAEFFQLSLLISPFALCLIVCSAFVLFDKSIRSDAVVQFVVVAALCGLMGAFFLSPGLGMSRDWDAFAPLMLMVVFAVGIVIARSLPALKNGRNPVVLILGISCIHLVSWVGINANVDASLKRFSLLPSDERWKHSAMTSAYEELAIYYRSNSDLPRAIEYYQKYLTIDSVNTRILARLGNTYHQLGDEKRELQTYSVILRNNNATVPTLISLAKIFMKHQQNDYAIEALQQALHLDPKMPEAHYYLATMLANRGNTDQAIVHFEQTLTLSPTALDVYLKIIPLLLYTSQKERASDLYKQFLHYAPPFSPAADSLRTMLERATSKMQR